VSPAGVAIRNGQPNQDQGVDEDDGVVDGLGNNMVWYSPGNFLPEYDGLWVFEISFTPHPVNGLPTFVGFALLGYTTFPPPVISQWRYRAYDDAGTDFTGDIAVDRIYLPPSTPYFSTEGDRFVGLYNSEGIRKVLIFSSRFDHLQFGWAIPEPGVTALCGLSASFLLCRRRRDSAR
jgi:hypothetical protein